MDDFFLERRTERDGFVYWEFVPHIKEHCELDILVACIEMGKRHPQNTYRAVDSKGNVINFP